MELALPSMLQYSTVLLSTKLVAMLNTTLWPSLMLLTDGVTEKLGNGASGMGFSTMVPMMLLLAR